MIIHSIPIIRSTNNTNINTPIALVSARGSEAGIMENNCMGGPARLGFKVSCPSGRHPLVLAASRLQLRMAQEAGTRQKMRTSHMLEKMLVLVLPEVGPVCNNKAGRFNNPKVKAKVKQGRDLKVKAFMGVIDSEVGWALVGSPSNQLTTSRQVPKRILGIHKAETRQDSIRTNPDSSRVIGSKLSNACPIC